MDIKKKINTYFRKEEQGLTSSIIKLLEQEGFRPEMSEECICFKYERCLMYIALDKKDSTFARIVLPRFFEIDKTNKNKANRIVNQLNARYKFTFLVIENEEISSLADIYITPENIGSALFRIINITKDIVRDFYEEMNKQFSDN